MLRISVVLLMGLAAALAVACADSAPARESAHTAVASATGPAPPATSDASTGQPPTKTATAAVTPAISDIPLSCAPPYPSRPYTPQTVFCADPASMEMASVVRIVDGDTFHALVGGREETIRIFGVDTPERGEACFGEATDELRLLTALNGGQVLLVPDTRNRDRYDRLLRYVYTTDGLSIDAVLIARGFAHAWTQDGALRDPLVALEDRARTARQGCLWR